MNSHRLQQEASAAAQLRQSLREELDDDDDDLWRDTVEGETGLLELIEKTIAAAREDEATADRLEQRIKQIAVRADRHRRRAVRAREMVAAAIRLAQLKGPLRFDEFTISVRNGSQRVVIDDPSKLPGDCLVQPEPPDLKPDKRLIAELLKGKVEVPGARFEDGDPILIVRAD